MSIILDRASLFLNSIKPEDYKKTTSGLIDGYSLVQQENENTLTITSYLKNKGWLKRNIPSSQTVIDTVYLISNDSLRDLVSRFKGNKQGCYIYQNDNGLCFSIFEGYEADIPNIYDNLLIKQYHGSVSEFGPAIFNTNTVVKISDDKLSSILNRLKAYGDYSSNSRPILIKGDLEEQTITFYANQAEGRNFICQISIECAIQEEFTIVFDGQDINSLLCIFDKNELESETIINLDPEGKSLTMSNALGSVTIKLLDLEINKNSESWLSYFKYDRSELYGYRVVDLTRFKACLMAQQPDKTYNNKSLKISSVDLNLSITKVADPIEKDYSLAAIVDIPSLETGWEDLAYNSSSLIKAVDAISKGKLIKDKEEPRVSITLVKKESKIKNKTQIRWLTIFMSKGLDDNGISTVVSTIGNPISEKVSKEVS